MLPSVPSGILTLQHPMNACMTFKKSSADTPLKFRRMARTNASKGMPIGCCRHTKNGSRQRATICKLSTNLH
jgi:hypothetical protein